MCLCFVCGWCACMRACARHVCVCARAWQNPASGALAAPLTSVKTNSWEEAGFRSLIA